MAKGILTGGRKKFIKHNIKVFEYSDQSYKSFTLILTVELLQVSKWEVFSQGICEKIG